MAKGRGSRAPWRALEAAASQGLPLADLVSPFLFFVEEAQTGQRDLLRLDGLSFGLQLSLPFLLHCLINPDGFRVARRRARWSFAQRCLSLDLVSQEPNG